VRYEQSAGFEASAPEDKEWVKRRMEVEQKARIAQVNKIIENDKNGQ
jgi:hypothetical protein